MRPPDARNRGWPVPEESTLQNRYHLLSCDCPPCFPFLALLDMTTAEALDQVRVRILSDYGLLFLKTFEEERWEAELAEVLLEVERGLVTWTITDGPQPPPGSEGAVSTDPL